MASLFNEEDRRQLLRRFDDCLETLEREHERGRMRVSGPLAEILGERVPGIRPGMLIIDAIDEVLMAQTPLLAEGAHSARLPRSRRSYLPRDQRDTFYATSEPAVLEPIAESA